MYSLSFDKINVIITYYDDIFGRYSIKKNNNDHFHPLFAIIVFNIKSYSFSIAKNKQSWLRFLVLEKFITCFAPCETTWHHFFIPLVLKSECKDGGRRE